jgi:hypothetical protein
LESPSSLANSYSRILAAKLRYFLL